MIIRNYKLIIYRVVLLALLLIVFLGILCVNYIASLVLIISIFLGVYCFNTLIKNIKKIRLTKKTKLTLKILLFSILLLILIALGLHVEYTSGRPMPFFEEYKLVIKPINSDLLKYEINEILMTHVTQEELERGFRVGNNLHEENSNKIKIYARKKRVVNNINIGLLLKEIYIRPFQLNADSYINAVLSNGKQWKGKLCPDSCPKSTVELVDFPQGSLYSIKNEEDFSILDKYLGNETLRWSVRDLNKGIRFAYIKPPFYIFARLIKPFLKLTESNQLFVVVFGLMFGLVIRPTIKLKDKKKPTQPRKILILAAIPHGLHLDKEIRTIEQCIRGAVKRDTFKVEVRVAVQDEDIRRAIAEEKPLIVHFCGHGLEDGSLLLENDKFISPSALATLFELHADYVECVILNACYSLKAAEAICQHISYTIGMNQPIEDKSAIKFAQGFYDGLGYEIFEKQYIYQRAFKEGLVAIKMDNLSQADIPVLKTNNNRP